MVLGNLSALISCYIPEELVLIKTKQMFETLIELLARQNIDANLKNTIVDNMFGFVSAPEHVLLALKWLETGKIFKDHEE